MTYDSDLRKNVPVSFDEDQQTVEAPEFNVKEGNVIVILQQMFKYKDVFVLGSTIRGSAKFYKVDEDKVGTGHVLFE